MRSLAILMVTLLLLGCASAQVQSVQPPSSETAPADGPERLEGLLNLRLDREQGKVWLELPDDLADSATVGSFLYVEGLVSGLGSNPVGLDRGRVGEAKVVSLRRYGNRLLIVEPNLRYRALTDDVDELTATRQSFAFSVLWAGEIERPGGVGPLLVDLTSFLIRDAHQVVATLAESGQGQFSLDADLSAVDFEACHAFPDNLEFEALLTYASREPGRQVRQTAPTAEAFTLTQHQSLIRLPDGEYQPRRFDPRSGSFAVRFADYATPLDRPIDTRWIVRHRLQKTDPEAERSPAVEPIVYYVDRGIPEPVRSAVLEGAAWWAEAFEAAGFDGAYRVELLPEGVHPLDVRYNVVQWVHRSTRGWSYGGGVIDPRTGEMIKGHVRLGSLRVRQDRLLFEGLAGTDKTGTGVADDPVELALARIRQLSAHEVGHTLGLTHNFAASTYGRASVMDYPAPLVRVDAEGELDFSDAYGVGVGVWDIHSIRYAYTEFSPAADADAKLAEIVDEGLRRRLVFLADEDARPAGAAEPRASLWDNGSDPLAQLELEMRVRRLALDRFGRQNVAVGTPLALLEEVLAPLYFHHRYQVAAAAKMLGGLEYSYAVRGDGQAAAQPIPGPAQRRAVALLLATLSPAELDLPEAVLELLLPRAFGYERNREMFGSGTSPAFDALGAAATAAEMTVSALLQPERAARMVDQHRRDPELPDFSEVLSVLVATVARQSEKSPRHAELRRRVEEVVTTAMIRLAADPEATGAVRARVEAQLEQMLARREKLLLGHTAETAHRQYLDRMIERHLERASTPSVGAPAAEPLPPGDPIGAEDLSHLGGCSWEDLPQGS
jgi:hypothetical protein